jgi:hypothetical protein
MDEKRDFHFNARDYTHVGNLLFNYCQCNQGKDCIRSLNRNKYLFNMNSACFRNAKQSLILTFKWKSKKTKRQTISKKLWSFVFWTVHEPSHFRNLLVLRNLEMTVFTKCFIISIRNVQFLKFKILMKGKRL